MGNNGGKARANRLTLSEQRWIRILKESPDIDLTQSFTAVQALDALRAYRCPRSRLPIHRLPNKYRFNYVLKKTKEFNCQKDKGNRNYWTLKEEAR